MFLSWLFIVKGLKYIYTQHTSKCDEATEHHVETTEHHVEAGVRRQDLPNFRKSEIIKHKSQETGIWVTYKNGVYDVTNFVGGHPGGEKILLASGGSLEPFWDLYGVHKKPEVYEMLEELRIGNVHEDDLKTVEAVQSNNPYANEPARHPALRVVNEKPFNAEAPIDLLTDNFITPNELFFTRNHLPVPITDKASFRLEISGIGIKNSVTFSAEELQKQFPSYTITAAIQCAGNRRSDMAKFHEVKGLSWGVAAISNAEWTGVKLADVLAAAGVSEDEVKHVIFRGADKDVEGLPYEASVPAETALDPRKDVLLAFAMNGKELSRDHGFPIRVIVPGTAGARCVKWVTNIITSTEESPSHWQRKDYRTFSPSVGWTNPDFDKAIPIQEYPIQSAICSPVQGAKVRGENLVVHGYAWSGGGRGIVRVDVSIDNGKTWHEAKLDSIEQKRHRQWAWTLWKVDLPLTKELKGPLEVICKATDTSHNTQPETAAGIWNLRGLVHNAWHRVVVDVE